MSNEIGNRNRGAIIMITIVALCMLLTGLFCVVDSMMPVDAASSVIPFKCAPTGCTPTPTPTKTPKPTPTPSPTPQPTPKPTSTPSPTPVKGHNPPTPTPTQSSSGSVPTPTPTNIVPLPPSTATAQANLTPAASATTQSSGGGLPPGGSPPSGGGNSGGSSTGIVFTFAALALALVAFLLYLISQGQTSLLVRLLSLVLPVALARRFGTK